MSAILSADDLNDFISPGVACIKPIETLPSQAEDNSNAYEVTTEDKLAASQPPPASISLTDCLACSGCVTSAEAVLVSLQSHTEVLNTLDAHPTLHLPWLHPHTNGTNGVSNGVNGAAEDGRIFVASVSPQVRASLAALYSITERQAGYMIEQLLAGPQGLKSGGRHHSGFTWVIDTNTVREAVLVAAADEVIESLQSPPTATTGAEGSINTNPKKPILTSACPGWICYAEKTHPYVLPHLSRLKSPQALSGTLVKSVLARAYNVPPHKIWHLAVMPCFDKKLEASRTELTSASWLSSSPGEDAPAVRDVDCVITAREILHLADARGIHLPSLPLQPLAPAARIPFPDPALDAFLFPRQHRRRHHDTVAGPSGGYMYHILRTLQAQHPGSEIRVVRGRNADVVDYALVDPTTGKPVVKMARYYGFRNIQNLVRRLKPKAASRMPGAVRGGGARRPVGRAAAAGRAGADDGAGEYAYVEVMACPGGCTNGGGQVKVGEVEQILGREKTMVGEGEMRVEVKPGMKEMKEWLGKVDEAYFSASDEEEVDGGDKGLLKNEDVEMRDLETGPHVNGLGKQNPIGNGQALTVGSEGITVEEGDVVVDGISRADVHRVLDHWAAVTGVSLRDLVFTSFREVESDVGKSTTGVGSGVVGAKKKTKKISDVERVAGLASSIGGGW